MLVAENNPGGSVAANGSLITSLNNYYRSGFDSRRYLFVKKLCEGKTVLDYGCGYGYGSLLLTKYNKYTGVDLDAHAIKWAKRNILPVINSARFLNAEEFEREYYTETFDMIISFEVIEHLRDPVSWLKAIKEKVHHGGRIILSTPNGAFANGDQTLFSNRYHLHEFSAFELRDMLRENVSNKLAFYKEERIDKLSSFWRQELGSYRKKWLRAKRASEETTLSQAGNKKSLFNYVQGFFASNLNGSFFWNIRPLNEKEFDSPGFTSIVVFIDII